jgi:hypothetical protein
LREYLPPESRFPVGDLVGMARWIEHIAAAHRHDLGPLQAQADSARLRVQRYSPDAQRATVLAAWRELLA